LIVKKNHSVSDEMSFPLISLTVTLNVLKALIGRIDIQLQIKVSKVSDAALRAVGNRWKNVALLSSARVTVTQVFGNLKGKRYATIYL